MPAASTPPVGLFFGSFNPLHNGHLQIARCLLEQNACREVWFVVSPRNPWKEDASLLDEHRRLAIVRAAIAGESRMAASDIEFDMSRPSYTWQTLCAFRAQYPDTPFALIPHYRRRQPPALSPMAPCPRNPRLLPPLRLSAPRDRLAALASRQHTPHPRPPGRHLFHTNPRKNTSPRGHLRPCPPGSPSPDFPLILDAYTPSAT